MLKTNIFAGGITNLTDARYFAARGAQYLSFNLDKGTALNISPEKTAAIKDKIDFDEAQTFRREGKCAQNQPG